MAQSLCKIYLHIIFHVKTTSPNVETAHLNRLHSYIAKLINTTGCKVLCVGGTENHVHTLLLLSNVENDYHPITIDSDGREGMLRSPLVNPS